MSRNESNWIESFMLCICASERSRASLNDGSLEGLGLASEPELQKGWEAKEEACSMLPGKHRMEKQSLAIKCTINGQIC